MSVRGVRVWRRSDPSFAPSVLIEKNAVNGSLLLQNGAIVTLDSEATEVEKRGYTKIIDAYGLMGILRISRDDSLLVAVTGVLSVGQLYAADIFKVINCEFVPLRTIGSAEYIDPRIVELQRLLSSGMFYFSSNPQFDLTSCAQRRASNVLSDSRFFWNRSLHFSFDRFGIDTAPWLLKCMAGSVLIRTVYVGHRTGRVALLSRLSCERVGTRFNVRGTNYLGSVANFVETEQLIVFDERQCSIIQVRGSIPLFWEQPGVQVGSHKVKLRAFEASAPAFHRHMAQLISIYGGTTIINLLGNGEGERILSEAFRMQHKNSKFSSRIEFINFDYHSQMRISKDSIGELKKKLEPTLKKYSFFVSCNGNIERTQHGVLRINCLDCLDRTNAVQTLVGLQSVREQVAVLSLDSGNVNVEQRIEKILADLWQKNGDQCSTIYAGTGALDGRSKFKDASRSLARTIQNNLMDGSKQESFDLFLAGTSFDARLFDRACNLLSPNIVQEYADAVEQVVERSAEITTPNPIKIFVGTWNVNGGKNMHNIAFRNEAKLSDWIFPKGNLVVVNSLEEEPEIVAIGLEELVDLNATNMVKASTTNQRLWCDGIRKALLLRAPYSLIASEQLVGVCLFLFVRPCLIPYMKDFAVASVKTGMGGTTGNKGSVAFRMVVHSTSFCFICSHFAAGQNEVKDRNEDYSTAMRKIRFPQGRDIDSNDVIFWLGDFNYRINLNGEEVKRAVQNGRLDQLIPNDQLTQQKAQGFAFVDFEEGTLRFAPTYKYDTFSDDYDTSEKCRAPAWTDRILWKEQRQRADTTLLRYDRAELKTSDHRPVSALFSVNVYRVDETKCADLVEDVIGCMGPPDGTVICSIQGRSKFPPLMFANVIEKLKELHTDVLLSKIEHDMLYLLLENGESAIAALSMDGTQINGETLSVRLRSPNWAEALQFRIAEANAINEVYVQGPEDISTTSAFDFEDYDDEILTTISTLDLERSRPLSANSEICSTSNDVVLTKENQCSPSHVETSSRYSVINMSPSCLQQATPLLRRAPPAPILPPRPQMPVIPPRPKEF